MIENNKGFEMSLTGNLIRKEDFNWNLGLNVTTVKNQITKMPDETPEIVSAPYKRMAGRSMYDYYTRIGYAHCQLPTVHCFKSSSTISLTNAGRSYLGCQPSLALAFVGSPTSRSTSVGR